MVIKRNRYGLKINAICASCAMCKEHDSKLRECELPIEGQKQHLVEPTDKCKRWMMHERYTELPGNDPGFVKDKRYLDFIVKFRLNEEIDEETRWKTPSKELRKLYEQQYGRSIYMNL